MRAVVRTTLLSVAAVLVLFVGRATAADEPAKPTFTAEQVDFFKTKVEPILTANCFKCHGNDLHKLRGGLYLKSRAGLMRGGDIGQVVNFEKPAESYLLKMINYVDDEHQMPPSGKLPPEQIATITKWIEMGSPWSPETANELPPALLVDHGKISDEDRSYWAYQPVKRPPVPRIDRAPNGWTQNPIDLFILAGLRGGGLDPNGPADKTALVRRVYYDLIGLPPTPDEVREFVNDASPEAYEKLIEKLLASPHYGEKWGRHWLDLVRYAETNSFERDGIKPNVWRYRDYVIRAFNADKPYDQFVREQIAGDELNEPTADSVTATGYYRLGLWDDEPADPEQAYFDGLDDIVSTTGQTFLAMSLNCARCHDHKIDPLPQEDYYRMLAFFRNVTPFSHHRGVDSHFSQTVVAQRDSDLSAEELRDRDQRKRRLGGEVRAAERQIFDTFSPPEREDAKSPEVRQKLLMDKAEGVLGKQKAEQYRKDRAELDTLEAVPTIRTLSVSEFNNQPKDTHVLARGSAHAPTKKVEPGYPSVLGFDDPTMPTDRPAKSTGRRLVLANWIASPENPLTARVMVNRIWQHHFGRGIVRSTSEFGKLGEKPTHPELLDWLAAEFIARGWSVKEMHRLIMHSAVYRMSSADNAAAIAKDPTNDLFWRFNMRRLTAEEIRDSILAVNGTLNPQMYGPWVYTKVPDAVLATASRPDHAWGKSPPDQQVRRSIYVHIKRSLLEPFLASFDSADTDFSCPVRFTTTVPTQSLTMLNSGFSHEQASLFADRLRRERPNDARAQVARALELVTQREPTAAEVDHGIELIEKLKNEDGLDADKAMDAFCLLALNLNEFIYLD